jgi:hypothetical protein
VGAFTTRVRYSKELEENTLSMGVFNDFRMAEYIYSWRSRRTKYDLDDSKTGSSVGIRTPNQKGSLAQQLADRKRYVEDIGMAMVNPRSDTQYGQIKICLAEDLGHPFTSVKWESQQEGRVLVRNSSTGSVLSIRPLYATGVAYVTPEVGSTPGFSTASLPSNISSPSVLERNARLNPVFQEMAPTHQIAQIGETIASLLRGDIPHILRKIEDLAKRFDWSAAAKTGGGEYLNVVFGWTPLIRDFENAIKVLTSVDYLLYGTSYRRHRTIKWDTKITRETPGSTSTRSNYSPQGPASVGLGQSMPEIQRIMSYDVKLSARLVPIARPGLGANSFIDQATEKLQQLGLWYPALGWDLLPYSWLLDWVTNLGSSINNALTYGSEPGMVKTDYAWATSCARVITHLNFGREGWLYQSGTEASYRGHPKTVSTVKTRFQANPFGFGLDLSSLTGGQIAILVALGLAKKP